jgi:single-strand DNA-binding protein
MNKLILTGRLTRDAEIKFSKTGTSIIEFDIANNTGYGEYKKTCFIACTIFKRDKLVDHLKKGKEVILDGELQQDTWEKEGVKHSKHKLIVNQLEFIGGKKEGAESTNGGYNAEDDIPF